MPKYLLVGKVDYKDDQEEMWFLEDTQDAVIARLSLCLQVDAGRKKAGCPSYWEYRVFEVAAELSFATDVRVVTPPPPPPPPPVERAVAVITKREAV